MFTERVLSAMRYPVQVFRGEFVRPNICGRTFSIMTKDIQPCLNYIGNRCCRKFFGGQMEHVLDNYVEVYGIHTPCELVQIVRELRNLGVETPLAIFVEYVEGYAVPFTTL